MNFRTAAFGLCLLALCSLGCSHSRPDPHTITLLIESSPANLDPRIGTDAQSERIDELLFDSLVRKDEHFNLQPSVAVAVTPMIVVGVAANAERVSATLGNALPNLSPLLPDGQQTLTGKGWDWGWSVGGQVRSERRGVSTATGRRRGRPPKHRAPA